MAGFTLEDLMNENTGPANLDALMASMGTGSSQAQETMSVVQAQTDLAMQDPDFRKAVGFKEPVDSLAADSNGWNLPKTGQANTTGATQRINARAVSTGSGVSASKDSSGRVTITNIGPSGNPNIARAETSYDISGQNGKSPLAMTSLLEQLRGASNPTEAAPIMDNIRATVAAEQSKIMSEAFKFASNKLGIPMFEEQLRAAEIRDKEDPAWFPGIGDSKGTAQVRQQLGILRGQAKEQANVYLETNLASGMLKAQALGAQEELKRIDRTTSKQDSIDAQETAYLGRKKELALEEAAILKSQIPEVELSALKILNPSLANGDDIAVGRAIKNLSGKPATIAALKAYSEPSGNSLIGLSVMNNADAKTLLYKREQQNNPTFTEEAFALKINEITKLADSKDFAVTAAKARFGNTTSKEAKAYIQEANGKKLTGDAKDKEMSRQQRIADSIQIVRKGATERFIGDVREWKSLDPEFNKAMVAALTQRGKTDLQTVLDVYVGSATGMDAAAKILLFNEITKASFGAQANSIFGKADYSYAQKILADKTKASAVGSSITNFLNKDMQISPIAFPLGVPINAGMNALQNIFANTGIPTDPNTGLPLAQ